MLALEPAFTSMFDGKILSNWKEANEGDFRGHGPIQVDHGQLLLGAGSSGTGIRWTGDFPHNNYEIELDAQRVDGSDFFCGLTFPIGDEKCTWIVGGWGGGTVGLSNVDSRRRGGECHQ